MSPPLRLTFFPVRSASRQKMPQNVYASEKKKDLASIEAKSVILLVGVAGCELATPCTPCKCATRLRYTPTSLKL
ncbi:MAG: hypothetical protein RLZ68_2275 [Pseudomonadota bacterium]